jgi:hypothetical protein
MTPGLVSVPDINPSAAESGRKSRSNIRETGMGRVAGRHSGECRE